MHRRSTAARPTTTEFQTINCLLTQNMRSMHSVRKTRQVAVLLLLLAIGFDWARVNGQDEYMTCSRPIKQSRTSKQINLPCEGMEQGKESWCNLPGPLYPWHAVRNFVFENQGLMRRMYGEVRQLSLLRMEFAGESNALDETSSGREFNDVFQPMLSTSLGPTPATTSTLVSMLSAPARQDTDEVDGDYGADVEGMEAESGASVTAAASTTEATPHISIVNADDDVYNVSDGGSNERFTTLADESEMASTTHDMLHDGLLMDTAPTDETPTTPLMDEDFGSSEEDGLVIILQPPSPAPLSSLNVSTLNASKNGGPTATVTATSDRVSNQESIEGKNRIDNHILFQDFERSSPQPQTPSPSPSPSLSPPPPPQASSSTVEESRVRSRVGVNACPVKEEVVAPYWANNTRGEILALLNLYPFEQYIHWEKCTNEHRQMYCRDGCRCEQQYRLHRLLAFDPSNECRGIFSDWFRFPSCCVCKCYFDEMPNSERISFNRSPRIIDPLPPQSIQDLDGPDVNGVDDSHFFYKYHHSFRHPRK